MKTYDEISKDVLKRRDQYLAEKKNKRKNILHISAAAICLILMTATSFALVRSNWLKAQIGGLTTTLPYIEDSQTDRDSTTKSPSVNHITSPTKTTDSSYATTTEIINEIDWNRKSTPGKFPSLSIGSADYLNAIDESAIGGCVVREYVYPFSSLSATATTRSASLLLSGTYISYCEPDGTRHTNIVDVFSLQGLSEDLALGVRFPDDEKIYTYVRSSFTPKTLGEFLNAIDYDNTITYGGITLYPGNNFPVNDQNRNDIKSYLFSDMSIANIMDANAEATGQCVTLSINCRELGRQSKTLKIYEDGHITTNLIGYGYTFYVGKEAVDNFLKDSYNITFEQIREIASTTQPLTSPTTTTAPPTSTVPTTTPPETVHPAEPIDTSTSAAAVIAEEPPVISDVTTTAIQEYAVDTATTNDTWWCGTETE